MAKSNETILVEACASGDIKTLKTLLDTKINMANKSRSKEFTNLFERALFTGLSATRNSKEVIDIICKLSGDKLQDLLKEEIVIKVANRYKFYAIDVFIEHGWSLDSSVADKNYKNVYDKLFRQSIPYARVEILEYLIPKMNIEWLDLIKLIPFIVENEDTMVIVESRLQDRIEGFTCIYALLCEHGLDPMHVAEILA